MRLKKLLLKIMQKKNYFHVDVEDDINYTEETFPGWRDTPEWKKCLDIYMKSLPK
jgi:hypothetical protein